MSGGSRPAPGDWGPGAEILGEFRIERELGRGGMGAVHLVHSLVTGERFAVKTVLVADAATERALLHELQLWIDLPRHPNLAQCRFFRTIGNRVAVFAEFAEGGSLADQIDDGRLASRARVLDVAIQLARGLHAAHEAGVVHQDVKPGNTLIDAHGTVKVSDFGLARVRASRPAGTAASPPARAGEETGVTTGGMTPAYQSPEQARGLRLGPATDQWSWGVTFLHMIAGEVHWITGETAAAVLEDYATVLPPRLVALLQRVFRREPSERWPALASAADELEIVFREVTGGEYRSSAGSATAPAPSRPIMPHGAVAERSVGADWADARGWLADALQRAGRDPAEAWRRPRARAQTSQAQAVADLLIYGDAQKLFEETQARGGADLRNILSKFYSEKALVHRFANDVEASLRLYGHSMAALEELVAVEGRTGLAPALAHVCTMRGGLLLDLGRPEQAVPDHERAVTLLEGILDAVSAEDRLGVEDELALAMLHLAKGRDASGQSGVAVATFERAVASAKALALRLPERWRPILADACVGHALATRNAGQPAAAAALYDRAIALLEELLPKAGALGADRLAEALMNKGVALVEAKEPGAASAVHARAVAIREDLVLRDGHAELIDGLGLAYQNAGAAAFATQDHAAASRCYDQAVALWSRLVVEGGRHQFAPYLAHALTGNALALAGLGRRDDARSSVEKAVRLLEDLVRRQGRAELSERLASALRFRASLRSSGPA